jgi:type II secretory pathway predicted ATPase ExeA
MPAAANQFHLKGSPFQTSPDPESFYPSEIHARVLDGVVQAVRDRAGLVLVLGGIGRGKTMICRMIQKQYHDEFIMGYVGNPFLSPQELGAEILREFGCMGQNDAPRDQVGLLGECLRSICGPGNIAVLFIDEAHLLSPDVLDYLLILTNVQQDGRHLLQIVLSGQPEFQETLLLPRFSSLNQRLGHRFELTELSLADTERYIRHRLDLAGAGGREFFTPRAVRRIWRVGRGTPRLMNQVCEHALRRAVRNGKMPVRAGDVRALTKDTMFSRVLGRSPDKRTPAGPVFAGLVFAGLAVLAATALHSPDAPLSGTETSPAAVIRTQSAQVPVDAAPAAEYRTPEAVWSPGLESKLERMIELMEIRTWERDGQKEMVPDVPVEPRPANLDVHAAAKQETSKSENGFVPDAMRDENEQGSVSFPEASRNWPTADVRVEAIVWDESPEGRLAVVDQRIVRQGERAGEWIVERILADRVILSRQGRTYQALNAAPDLGLRP